MNFNFSIVIPCFNEELTVSEVVSNICISFSNDLVVVVDDGSTDNSFEILERLNFSNLHLIRIEKNKGKGHAMRTGLNFVKAKSDVIIFTDADKEILIKDLIKVKEYYLENDCVALFGSRFLSIKFRKVIQMGLHRYLANRFLTFVANMLFKQKLSDMETAVKSFKLGKFQDLKLESDGFEIEPELVKEISKSGIKIKEIPISYEPRSNKEGKKISFKDGYLTLKYLINLAR